jgi:RimJ/RimL family protein N-acetyltransferase
MRDFGMLDDESTVRVRSLWRELMRAPDGFSEPGWDVVASSGHRSAPDGWVGIVEILDSVVIAAPDELVAALTGRAEAATSTGSMTDARGVHDIFGPIQEVLGPAVLFYGDAIPAEVRHEVVGPVRLADERVQSVLASVSADEADESGVLDTTSGVWLALDDQGRPAALSGWREWPQQVAHMSIITASTHRAMGLGSDGARAALVAARNAGLLPQWRAAEANAASVNLANRLGLQKVGRQISLRVGVDGPLFL